MTIRTNYSHTIDHVDINTLLRLLGENVSKVYEEYGEIDVPREISEALMDTGAGLMLDSFAAIDYEHDYQRIWKLYNSKKKGNDYGI